MRISPPPNSARRDAGFTQVRKAAQNVANVVTYVAVIGFSNVGDRLIVQPPTKNANQ